MPVYTIEIGGKRYDVEADGEQAAISAAQQYASGPSVGVAEDVARAIPAGVATGIENILNIPSAVERGVRKYAVSPLMEKLGLMTPEQTAAAESLTAFPTADIGRMATGLGAQDFTVYEPQTMAGKIAGTSAEFAPTALAFGPAGIARKLLYGAVAPAIGSETAGAMTEGEPIEPYARFAGSLMAPLALGAGEGAVRSLISPTGGANPEILASARLLSDKYGVQPTAGMATADRAILAREGATRAGERMQNEVFEQWTEAVLRQAGIPAKSATPQVIDDAFRAAGDKLDDLAGKTNVLIDDKFVDDIAALVDDFTLNGGTGERPREVLSQILDIATNPRSPTVIRGNTKYSQMGGDAYQQISSSLRKGATAADNPALRQFSNDVRQLLNNAIGGSIPAGQTSMASAWAAANRAYANIVPVAEASRYAKGGQFTPSMLMSALANQSRRNVQRGRGDLAELARAGYDVLQRTPSSGTSERLMAAGAGGAGPAGAGAAFGAASGHISAAGQMALAGGLLAPLRNRFAQSWVGQNIYYPNQLLSPIPRGTGEIGMMSAIPQAAGGLLSQLSSAQ